MTAVGSILRLEVLPAPRLASRTRDELSSVLGGACYAHPAMALNHLELPIQQVDMALPASAEATCEIWHSAEPLESGQQGAIRFRECSSLLFGSMCLDEAALPQASDGRTPLQATTAAAYQAIFKLLEARGYTSLLRVWNYFADINAESYQIERYRQFNIGRQEAFVAHDRSVIGNVPAACALGTAAGGLNIAFLATRAEVIAIENPRQVSAFHYPSQYGPRSPTFARAGLVNLSGHDVLFISGTASIVGHQTLHAGDVVAQTRECLHNIAAVVEEANRVNPRTRFNLDTLVYKVYLRDLANQATVREAMKAFMGVPVSPMFLQADICRADLLVEIEASGGHADTPISPVAG
ncbi:MAG TPA: Rid family hydrolase [Thiobacillus sp.]